MTDDAIDVLRMVGPPTVARTKLPETAALQVDDAAGRSARASVVFIGHTVTIGIGVADRTAIGINNGTQRRIRTMVAVIRNAIAICIHNQRSAVGEPHLSI